MARPVIHDAALRARLLSTATEHICERGHSGLVLREVAAAAGTSTSAIYSLFGGKAELLTAVIEEAFTSFGDSQRLAARDGLAALGRAYRQWALGHRALYGLMFGGASAAGFDCRPAEDIAASSMGPVHSTVAALLEQAGSQEPAHLVAAAIWGQVHGLVSLELAQVGIPGLETSWDATYETAVRGVVRLYGAG
ncbi:TetR-like C-terminal domain-containing protein [Arthrobacter rhombi]|uniref:TetR-like C-terminal domain-containing protein n=1 Tax=Arthrobacter rhombi TaxID=71253 RepID=UPI0031D289D4